MAFSVLIKNERAKLQGWTNARQLGASYALFRKELQGKVACMLSLFRYKDEDFSWFVSTFRRHGIWKRRFVDLRAFS